jgi:hypothetical protein
MDKHSEMEFDFTIERLERNIHDLTAEQALAYIAHKLLTTGAGVYLFGLRTGLPEEYQLLKTSDTQLTAGFKRLNKWGLAHPAEKTNVGGQGRPRSVYRRVDTPEAILHLKQLALAWEDAPWKTTGETGV